MHKNVKINRVGETNIAQNGQKMKIIEYNGYHNVTIEFEDGTIVYNKRYDFFKLGYIVNPNKRISYKRNIDRTGESIIARNGLKMTIIAYRNAFDLDVQFENGKIVKNKGYKEFVNGIIGCSEQGIYQDYSLKYKGQSVIASNGQKMTIISYKSNKDIDVLFEDGTIVKSKSYSAFQRGLIQNPNYTAFQKMNDNHIGETNIALNGLKMEIIKYRNYNDIDVRFEDGIVVKHKNMLHFKEGHIKHPNINVRLKSFHIGEQNINKDGISKEIIEYNKYDDITVKFETGYITQHKAQDRYKKHRIIHPFPYQMDNILIEKKAYIYNNIGNFYCKCVNCGYTDVMSIKEMKAHQCGIGEQYENCFYKKTW